MPGIQEFNKFHYISGNTNLATSTHNQALVLQEALHHIPNPASDCMVRNVASRLAQSLHDQVTITSCLWAHFVRSRGFTYVWWIDKTNFIHPLCIR